MEGEWLCYGGGQFNVMLSRVHEYSNASQLHCQNEYRFPEHRFPDSINRQ